LSLLDNIIELDNVVKYIIRKNNANSDNIKLYLKFNELNFLIIQQPVSACIF